MDFKKIGLLSTLFLLVFSTAASAIGSWSIQASPDSTQIASQLEGVTIVSPTEAWAVGYSQDSLSESNSKTLIEHYTNGKWSVVSSPNKIGAEDNELQGVSAIAPNDVWAVGRSGSNNTLPFHKALVEHWNGSTWTIVSTPEVPNSYSVELKSISALSKNDVWAAGYYSNSINNVAQPLILHWNGTKWEFARIPPSADHRQLFGITAIAANDVWAVGNTGGLYGGGTLALHFDGVRWKPVATPALPPQAYFGRLLSVSASSTNDVWAVGSTTSAPINGPVDSPVALHWDGISWKTTKIGTLTPDGGSQFEGVTAVGPNDAWIVTGNYYAKTLHWDGTQWSQAVTENPNVASNSNLMDVASKNGTIIAVGHYYNPSTYPPNPGLHTLVEKYSG